MISEQWLFLAAGLGIVVLEAHRQFNEPSYARPGRDEAEIIYFLNPSEIRSRTAFFSAEIVYIGAIVVLYLLFVFNDGFRSVVEFILRFLVGGGMGADVAGGFVPPQGATAPATSVAQEITQETTSALDAAATPFLVAVTLVTSLRLPGVRRIEVALRSFAHRLFGIPRIPDRLRQKIEDTPVDLAAIERDLPADGRGVRYAQRVAGFVAAAKGAVPENLDRDEFERNLSKVLAYQIWVRDLKIWPSTDFRNDFGLFRTLNETTQTDISALIKDLDLLSNPSVLTPAPSRGPNVAVEDREITDGRLGMQRELWEIKIAQAAKLARRVASMMALYDQNSNWPEAGKPAAASLRAFLSEVRAEDDARTVQINIAIILILLAVFANATAGVFLADRMERIATAFGALTAQPDAPAAFEKGAPLFDRFGTARNFAFTALIVYGLSIWIALGYRRRAVQSGNWPNFFNSGNSVPPMMGLAPLVVVLFVGVYSTFFADAFVKTTGWNPEFWMPSATADPGDPRFEANWWKNVQFQHNMSLIFATVGTVQGLAVAILMDLGRRQFESYVWIAVILAYVLLMGALGYFVGHLLGSDAFLGHASHPAVAAMRPDAQAMRAQLYGLLLACVAIMTSFALTSLIRPLTPPPNVPARADEERLS